MIPVKARAVYLKQEVTEDRRSMARVERMLPFIHCEQAPVVLDDAGLCRLLSAEQPRWHRHGLRANEVEPVVIFNQFLYGHSAAERERRKAAYPGLFKGGGPAGYGVYAGFDWRPSGDAEYRRKTGLICQPAYALHSFWGCHFRCAYCNLGHVAHIYANVEEWVAHIERSLAHTDTSRNQKLFQWDNGTDVACWEPEYDASRQLVELFARQPDKHLELYIGKSDHVGYLLGYEHRGHTVCCWSLSHETQARVVEPRTASMEGRLRAARQCQEAGYPVRIRFSPMVPTTGWEADVRHMIRRLFEELRPEVLTIEPLRFYSYPQLCEDFAPGVIDPEFVEGLRQEPTADGRGAQQFPDALVQRLYRVVFDEVLRTSPRTPVAFCREKRSNWDVFRSELQCSGQAPDDYVCNCGPVSAGPDPRLSGACAHRR